MLYPTYGLLDKILVFVWGRRICLRPLVDAAGCVLQKIRGDWERLRHTECAYYLLLRHLLLRHTAYAYYLLLRHTEYAYYLLLRHAEYAYYLLLRHTEYAYYFSYVAACDVTV